MGFSWLSNVFTGYHDPIVKVRLHFTFNRFLLFFQGMKFECKSVLLAPAQVAFVTFVASLSVFLLSLPTNNHSWVDKSWSILPVIYAWMIATQGVSSIGEMNPRLALIAFLVTVWGVRLTFNFWRKGGYAWNAEDYRWPILRERMHPIVFQLFNFVFVAIIQNLLLSSLLLPAYVAWKAKMSSPHLNVLDGLASVAAAAFLFMEAVADNQQWKFQTAKHAAIHSRKRLSGIYAKGFLDTGLWRYSRHPNFFAEQSFWWSLCLFATAATGHAFGVWMVGAFTLTLLFQGSTALTETITASKYPAYANYQKTTSKLVPWFHQEVATRSVASPRPRRVSTGTQAVTETATEDFKTPVTAEAEVERKRGKEGEGEGEETEKKGTGDKKASRRSASRSQSRSRSRPRTQASSGKKTESKTAKPRSARSSSTGPAKKKRESSTGDGKTEKTTTSSRGRSSSRPRRSKSASRSSDAAQPQTTTVTTRRSTRSRAA